MFTTSASFAPLRSAIAELPVIDTHEHWAGPAPLESGRDPLQYVCGGYLTTDLASATEGWEVCKIIADPSRSIEDRYAAFEKAWRRTRHTGYAMCLRRLLRKFYGCDEPTLENVRSLAGRMLDTSGPAVCDRVLDDAHIRCRLVDCDRLDEFLAGKLPLRPGDRYMVRLMRLHHIFSGELARGVGRLVGADVTGLDEYVHACREILTRCRDLGAAGFKDQSAYERPLYYASVPREQAEAIFSGLLQDPRRTLDWAAAKPLSDYIFHQLLAVASDLAMPVQLHTGHMAGGRNDVTKANAALLTNVIQTYPRVRFDLFHANWPYAEDVLFLAKSHPNVHLDFCWTHIIDPVYAKRLLVQSVSAVPHAKVHGFGGDFSEGPEFAVAHLEIALDVIAAALAELVDWGWMSRADAVQLAADWLYNNPSEWFNLPLPPCRA